MAAILAPADKTVHTEFAYKHTHSYFKIMFFFSLLNQYHILIIKKDLNLYLPGLNAQSKLSQPKFFTPFQAIQVSGMQQFTK